MDQSPQNAPQPKGNLVAFINRDKVPGDDKPMFVNGRIAKPGEKDEFPLSLWAFQYTDKKTGETRTGFNGIIGARPIGASAAEQVSALLTSKASATTALQAPGGLSVDVHRLTVFPSVAKEGVEPNPKAATHYGYANFGDGTPLVQASLWLQTADNGSAMLAGNTQFPLPAREGRDG